MDKFVIMSDSLGLPRPFDNLPIEKTYAYLLHSQEMYVINRSVKAGDSFYFSRSHNLLENVQYINPNYFVIHLGIVDCTPRLFSRNIKSIMSFVLNNNFGLFFNFIKKIPLYYINKRSGSRAAYTKKKLIQHVTVNDFDKNLDTIINNIKNESTNCKKIYLVSILKVSQNLSFRNYNFDQIIKNYNKIIKNKVNEKDIVLIDLYDFTEKNPETVLSCGHHINEKAHEYIYHCIKNDLNRKLP